MRKPLDLRKSPIFTNTPCKSPVLCNAPSVHTVDSLQRLTNPEIENNPENGHSSLILKARFGGYLQEPPKIR